MSSLHEFDDWYAHVSLRPEWEHLALHHRNIGARRKLAAIHADCYADDWVAVWNGSRDRAEEIKAEIKAFLANVLKLKLSEENHSTLTMASNFGLSNSG